ncbi:MAG: DUF3667 domain-containing protein [Rudaea sp.]
MKSTNANVSDTDTPATNASSVTTPHAKALCANCGAELCGTHCHDCGQPVKGMIRPLSSMLSDIADTIFNIDSRIFRTLYPLYFRPGYLSNQYFSGRRVRYVTPFRLYFFLSVAAFLLIQVSLDSFKLPNMIVIDPGDGNSFANAKTAQQVVSQSDSALAALKSAKHLPFVPTMAINQATREIHENAERRLAQLKDERPGNAQTTTEQNVESPKSNPKGIVQLGDEEWDPRANPIRIAWLPEFANNRINNAAVHLHDNLPRIKKNPLPFFVGTLGVLPGVLFVLMPLFALMLKIFYFFKRRLYMEHLIVALNSHSFIFVSLILLTLAGLTKMWANTAAPWLAVVMGWAIFLMGWWLPIYLLLMQKKVYKQGWILTVLKYCTIGIGYTLMIALGISAAFVVSLATT